MQNREAYEHFSSQIARELSLARRVRDHRNWVMLAFVVIGLAPTAAIIVFDMLPGFTPKLIFAVGVGVSVFASQLAFGVVIEPGIGIARCPGCHEPRNIPESGLADNRHLLREGGA